MEWPFKTIKQDSSWPLHPMLVQAAGAIISVPSELRKEMLDKTLERLCRLIARLAVEFDADSAKILEVMAAQLIREGGPKFQARLEEAAHDKVANVLAHKDTLTDFMANLTKPDGDPN